MGPLDATYLSPQLYIQVSHFDFSGRYKPCHYSREYVDLLILQTAMELCFICPHI